MRVTTSPTSAVRNKPRDSEPAPTAILPAEPPLRGTAFPGNKGVRLCAGGAALCDFGDHSAPRLVAAYVSDIDNTARSKAELLAF